jgi:hypothetical protein
MKITNVVCLPIMNVFHLITSCFICAMLLLMQLSRCVRRPLDYVTALIIRVVIVSLLVTLISTQYCSALHAQPLHTLFCFYLKAYIPFRLQLHLSLNNHIIDGHNKWI